MGNVSSAGTSVGPPELLSETEFVAKLLEDVDSGYGLIPFTGSGISIGSGILAAFQFKDYLRYCIFLSIVKTKTPGCWKSGAAGTSAKDAGYWIPDFCGWPERPSTAQVDNSKRFFEMCAERVGKEIQKGEEDEGRILVPAPPSSVPWEGEIKLSTALQALGSLGDWREMLVFLSRVWQSADGPGTSEDIACVGPSNPGIIDSFYLHLTSGRKPNLAHRMLASLSAPARIRTILTTNIDTLQETAFEDFRVPLATFDVHQLGELPNHHLVRAQNSIIKMHGSRFGIRTDLTLDLPPTEADRDRFCQYFYYEHGKRRAIHSNLVVLGFSGADYRVRRFFDALMSYDPQTDGRGASGADGLVKMYWICFTERDFTGIKKHFGGKPWWTKERVVPVLASPDILLLEFYQRLTFAPPPTALGNIFSHHRPPNAVMGDVAVTGLCKCDREKMFIQEVSEKLKTNELVILDGERQATLAAIRAAERLRARLWYELSEFVSFEHLLYEFCQSICKETMRYDTVRLPFKVGNPIFTEYLGAFLKEAMSTEREPWTVFFFARSLPGSDVGWGYRSLFELGMSDKGFWPEECTVAFAEFIKCLRGTKKFRVMLVKFAEPPLDAKGNWKCERYAELMTDLYDSSFLSPLRTSLGPLSFCTVDLPYRMYRSTGGVQASLNTIIEYFGLSGSGTLEDSEWGKTAKRIVDDSHRKESYDVEDRDGSTTLVQTYVRNLQNKGIHLLFGLAQSRHLRPLALLYGDGAFPCPFRYNLEELDNDETRAKMTEELIDWLVKKGLVFRKSGGFAWTFLALREALYDYLISEMPDKYKDFGLRPPAEFAAASHYHMAEWYQRLFHSSNHLEPLVESLYHYMRCILMAKRAVQPKFVTEKWISTDEETGRKADKWAYRFHLIVMSLNSIAAAIRSNEERLQHDLCPALARSMFSTAVMTGVSDFLRKLWKEYRKKVRDTVDMTNFDREMARVILSELKSLKQQFAKLSTHHDRTTHGGGSV